MCVSPITELWSSPLRYAEMGFRFPVPPIYLYQFLFLVPSHVSNLHHVYSHSQAHGILVRQTGTPNSHSRRRPSSCVQRVMSWAWDTEWPSSGQLSGHPPVINSSLICRNNSISGTALTVTISRQRRRRLACLRSRITTLVHSTHLTFNSPWPTSCTSTTEKSSTQHCGSQVIKAVGLKQS